VPFLSQSQAHRGEAEALQSAGKSLSFAALDRAAEKAARQLVTLGILPGEVVALKGHPDARLLIALHGIWKAGAVPFPMNPRWAPAEEARAAETLSPEVVLLGEGMAPIPGDLRHLALGGTGAAAAGLGQLWPDSRPLPVSRHPGGAHSCCSPVIGRSALRSGA